MGPRGSSDRTKAQIVRIARELFATHGIEAVSVRRIAMVAGIDQALVHHYFGTRSALITAVIRAEVEAAATMSLTPTGDSNDLLRQILGHYLGAGQTTAVLIARAQLAGLAPETMVPEGVVRPLALLARGIAEGQAASSWVGTSIDPALVSVVAGAAMMGLAVLAPWLLTGVGLAADELDARRDEIVDILVWFINAAAGTSA
jgi:AcrR family transcriptional regulator